MPRRKDISNDIRDAICCCTSIWSNYLKWFSLRWGSYLREKKPKNEIQNSANMLKLRRKRQKGSNLTTSEGFWTNIKVSDCRSPGLLNHFTAARWRFKHLAPHQTERGLIKSQVFEASPCNVISSEVIVEFLANLFIQDTLYFILHVLLCMFLCTRRFENLKVSSYK